MGKLIFEDPARLATGGDLVGTHRDAATCAVGAARALLTGRI
jgi:hypothetical protein